MALGAAPARVRRLVLGQALGPVLVGLAAGAAMAWWGSRILASQLYGLDPRDAAAFAGSILVLLAVAALAAWWPSRQVARVDPMQTLRAN
jgi:ABC-type antimicrobial peptide transport system permease subunit